MSKIKQIVYWVFKILLLFGVVLIGVWLLPQVYNAINNFSSWIINYPTAEYLVFALVVTLIIVSMCIYGYFMAKLHVLMKQGYELDYKPSKREQRRYEKMRAEAFREAIKESEYEAMLYNIPILKNPEEEPVAKKEIHKPSRHLPFNG